MKKASVFLFIMGIMSVISGYGRGSSAETLSAQEINNPALATLTGHYGARNFITGAIPKADLDTILLAGLRSPSANNRQPWHFTVVQNQNLGKQIISNLVEGNVLIIVSALGDGKTDARVVLDCALATENLYLAAQALGLGSRIYTGPMDTINNRFKTELDIPHGYSAITLVRIGRVPPGIDGVSAASSRKNLDSMVNYK
jgi:nitroreductase